MGEFDRSVVVHTLLRPTDVAQFDRWGDAILSAMSSAFTTGDVGGWQVRVGVLGGDNLLSTTVVAEWRARAQTLGGHFSFEPLSNNDYGDYATLLATGEEELVLIADVNTIVLGTTIVRLIRAMDSGAIAVAPRQIPRGTSTAVESTGTTVPTFGCMLVARATLGRTHGSGLAGVIDAGRIHRVPDAIVFRDTGALATQSSLNRDDDNGRAAVPSLLEGVLERSGLTSAAEIAAGSLTPNSAPILSIVMRTQTLRAEALREALLCLAGQSDGRFEVLLVVHDGDPDIARQILDDQPHWLRSRTRILTAAAGTRSRPLNVGIAAASGSLVAFLDDDDLVFSHWVGAFLDARIRYPRSLIRARVGVQHVTSVSWPGGVDGHQEKSSIEDPYPRAFDLADHLRVNMTPFMAFAFPRGFFVIFGGADESLEVCEDWDLVLRAASILGVTDVDTLTAVYRRWNSGGDSYTVHQSAVWERDMARVRQKLDAWSLLLPPGSASKLAQMSSARVAEAELSAVLRSSSWRITAPLRALSRRLRSAASETYPHHGE